MLSFCHKNLFKSAAGSLLLCAATMLACAQSPPSVPACNGGSRWIVNSGSLKRSQAEFPLEAQKKYFDSPCTFLVIGGEEAAYDKDWNAIKTRTITNLAALDEVVKDPTVTAVLYDPEAWEMTPRQEQTHPLKAVCRAAAAAHAQNKLLIATPAINLVRFLSPGSAANGERFAAFQKTHIAGDVAKCADVYEIQAQGAEMDSDKFRDFVTAEAEQARAANPNIIVLAGISTNPMGQRVTAEQLFKAVQSVRNVVAGFWLNIPAGGKYCPSCGEPQPKVAVDLLKMLAHQLRKRLRICRRQRRLQAAFLLKRCSAWLGTG